MLNETNSKNATCRALACLLLLVNVTHVVHCFTTISTITPKASFVTKETSYSKNQQLYLSNPLTSAVATSAATASASSITSNIAQNELMTYFLQTLISTAVPAAVSILVIAFAAKSFSGGNNGDKDSPGRMSSGFDGYGIASDIYSDIFGEAPEEEKSSPLSNLFSSSNKRRPLKNVGQPSETYLTITKYNDILNSYQYSLTSALESKASASKTYRSQTLGTALQKVLPSSITINSVRRNKLLELEKDVLKEGSMLLQELQELQRDLVVIVMKQKMKDLRVNLGELDPPKSKYKDNDVIDVNATSSGENKFKSMITDKMPIFDADKREENKILKKITELQEHIIKYELDFLSDVVDVLGSEHVNGLRAVMLGQIAGSGEDVGGIGNLVRFVQSKRPLASLLQDNHIDGVGVEKKRLFVTDFPGDVTASQVDGLREEVTAILRSATPQDEVMIVLESGGGTVTGYGLAAAQLKRIKDANLKLTICVEQVAASGGYMMCCVADRIVASPFAVLGSIGVVAEQPNVYERLKKEGIEFQTVTAGKYKRTLTPTKKPNKEDFQKYQEELQDVLVLFKEFVKTNRPTLDIDTVATGETWFGENALKKGLCDEIKTQDDVLLEFVDDGYDVYFIQYTPPVGEKQSLLNMLPVGSVSANNKRYSRGVDKKKSWLRRAASWVVQEVREEFIEDTDQREQIQNKYMAKDDSQDLFRF